MATGAALTASRLSGIFVMTTVNLVLTIIVIGLFVLWNCCVNAPPGEPRPDPEGSMMRDLRHLEKRMLEMEREQGRERRRAMSMCRRHCEEEIDFVD